MIEHLINSYLVPVTADNIGDSLSDGVEITAEILSAGWMVFLINAGEEDEASYLTAFRAEHDQDHDNYKSRRHSKDLLIRGGNLQGRRDRKIRIWTTC